MTILITGSRGLLGSHIARAFTAKNLDFLSPSKQQLDCTNYEDVLRYISNHKVSEVVHCAAKVGGISENIRKPADFILENLMVDANFLSAARHSQVRKLLYFGSSCMYPPDGLQPFNELQLLSGPLEPTNEYYALAKSCGVKTVQSVAIQDGLDWKTMILSNIYGPMDNFSAEDSHLVAAIISKATRAKKSKRESLEIWGDGMARREFTYVADVAEYIGSIWEKLETLPIMMNLGTEKDYSVYEYYRLVCEILDYSPFFKFDLTKPNGMDKKLMDSTLAMQFGWNPKTTLQDGLFNTIKWFEGDACDEQEG